MLVETVFYLGFSGFSATGSLYFIDKFLLKPWQTGLLFCTSGVALALVQAALVGAMVRKRGEKVVVALGLTGTAMAAVGAYFVPVMPMVFPAIFILSSMVGMVFAPLGSLAILNAPEDKKGALSGVMTSLSGIAAVFGPILAGRAYDTSGKGTPYLFGAVVVLVGLLLLLFVKAPRLGQATAVSPEGPPAEEPVGA
jgi:DHA1 family tetracycline resistance protein-like MFS transporter